MSKLLSTKVFSLTAMLLVAMASAACSPAADNEPDGQETSTPASISFLVFGDPAEKAAYETLVAAFEEKYADIDVDLQHVPSQDDYRTRLGTDFAAGTPADITLINYRRFAEFAERGVLEPVGPYLDQSSVIKAGDFYPAALEAFRWEGTLICIPQNMSSLVVYYNKALFDAAGVAYPADDWTWDDFLETAQALTLDTDGDGQTDQFGLGTEPSVIRVAPFIWQNGGEIVDDEEHPTRLTLDTPEAREAIAWFVALQTEHGVVPDRVSEESEDSESRFINGRMGMYLDSRRVTPTFREIEGFDWDVASLPRNKVQARILHSDAYCMSAAADNKDAVWTFIEFANSVEGQTIVAQTGRTVPSLIAVSESPAFLDPNAKPQNSRVWISDFDTVRAVPIMSTWGDIEGLVGEELERAFYGDVSVDEMISAAIDSTKEFFGTP
jgi:multiple sugar transport system substrate-binding protein